MINPLTCFIIIVFIFTNLISFYKIPHDYRKINSYLYDIREINFHGQRSRQGLWPMKIDYFIFSRQN